MIVIDYQTDFGTLLLLLLHTHMYIHVITLRFYKRDGKGRQYNTAYSVNNKRPHKIWKCFVVIVFQSTPEKGTERMSSFFLYIIILF